MTRAGLEIPGSEIAVAARASLKNRVTMSPWLEKLGCSTLSAARRPSIACSASQTAPIPPSPIWRITRYAPTCTPPTILRQATVYGPNAQAAACGGPEHIQQFHRVVCDPGSLPR